MKKPSSVILGLRNYLGLTQSELAQKLDVSRTSISLLENGITKNLNSKLINQISALINSTNKSLEEISSYENWNFSQTVKYLQSRLRLASSKFSRLLLNTSINTFRKCLEGRCKLGVKNKAKLIRIYEDLKAGKDPRRILFQLAYNNFLLNSNGTKLWLLRKKYGFTQREFCNIIGIKNSSQVTEWELGYRNLTHSRLNEIQEKLKTIKKKSAKITDREKISEKNLSIDWNKARKYIEIIGFKGRRFTSGTKFERKIADTFVKFDNCDVFRNCIIANSELEEFMPDVYVVFPEYKIWIEAKDRTPRNVRLVMKKTIQQIKYIKSKLPFINYFLIVTPDADMRVVDTNIFILSINDLKKIRQIILKQNILKQKIILPQSLSSGKDIKKLRMLLNLTRTQLAFLLDVSSSLIYKIEKTNKIPDWVKPLLDNFFKMIKESPLSRVIFEANRKRIVSAFRRMQASFVRQRLNISMSELAKRLKTNKVNIQAYEKGRRNWSSLEERIWRELKTITLERGENWNRILFEARSKIEAELNRWKLATKFPDVINIYRLNQNSEYYKKEEIVSSIFQKKGFDVLQNVEVMSKSGARYEVDVYAIKDDIRIICEVKNSLRRLSELERSLSTMRQDLNPDFLFLICFKSFDERLINRFNKQNIILTTLNEFEREVKKIGI